MLRHAWESLQEYHLELLPACQNKSAAIAHSRPPGRPRDELEHDISCQASNQRPPRSCSGARFDPCSQSASVAAAATTGTVPSLAEESQIFFFLFFFPCLSACAFALLVWSLSPPPPRSVALVALGHFNLQFNPHRETSWEERRKEPSPSHSFSFPLSLPSRLPALALFLHRSFLSH